MASDNFPTSTAGLAPSVETPVVELSDGDELDLTIAPVTKEIDGDTLRMLAYNGSIPGPTLKVKQGSEIVVNVRNDGDLEATVHWHGLRLDNRYDGTHETQAPIPVGGSFTYRIEFPDPGLYWYHPHIREDYGQELGLYGNIVVEPADDDYWPPAHREVVLTLDDILIEDGHVRRVQPLRADPRRDGPLRHHDARRRRDRARPRGEARRGRPLLPHEHGQHARVQGRRRRRADEARRRRQRPRTSARSSSRTSSSRPPSASWSTCSSTQPARQRSSTARPRRPTGSRP